MEFSYSLKALKVAGFLNPMEKKPSKLMVFWNLFTVIPFITIHVLLMAEMFMRKFNDYSSLYAKVLTERPAPEMVEMLRADEEMRKLSAKSIRNNSLLLFLSTAFCIVGLIALFVIFRILATILSGDTGAKKKGGAARLIIYIMWWFSDVRATPTYYYIVTWQGLTVITYLVITATENAFTCGLMLAVTERSAMLARTASSALMPGPDCQVTQQCETWIKYHQHYLRIVDKTNAVAGPLLLITHFSVFVTMISFTYLSLKLKDTMTAGLLLLAAFGILSQLSITSAAGQKVIDKSLDLSRSVVSTAQVSRGALKPGPACSVLSVIVTRLSGGDNFECISGLGFFHVSMQFFQSVLNAAVSYLLVLLHFQSSGPKLLEEQHNAAEIPTKQ